MALAQVNRVSAPWSPVCWLAQLITRTLACCSTRPISPAPARNRSWAWSTPALTTASPYSHTWGTNITSNAASTAPLPAQSALAKAWAYSPAPTSAASPAGVSTSSVQVSRADTVSPASSRRPAPTWRATTGMTTPASTPPATISNNALGRLFAALYTSPTQVSPTVLENTSDRPNPRIRAARVSPATLRATATKLRLTRVRRPGPGGAGGPAGPGPAAPGALRSPP